VGRVEEDGDDDGYGVIRAWNHLVDRSAQHELSSAGGIVSELPVTRLRSAIDSKQDFQFAAPELLES
jgi:hypothetical protein